MTDAYPALTGHLADAGTDGYLLDADGDDSNQRYLSGMDSLGEFVALYADGEVRLLVPDLEAPRAEAESDADAVRRRSEFGFGDLVVERGPALAGPLATARFLADYGVESVSVPPNFPTGTADALRDEGIEVVADYDDAVTGVRAVKSPAEIEAVAAAQRANEDAMAAVEALLADAAVEDGVLRLGGDTVTSERVREVIEAELRDAGCELSECIVASGPEAAKAHAVGSGPIRAGEPVIVDVFPRDEASGYVGDMTRTFVKGDPDEKVREWYEVTREAYETALAAIEPGVTGEAVNDAVCDVFEAAGYPTLRTDEATDDGLYHPTGHGVGLDLHEEPKLSWGAGELEPGNVVTVEPGCYEQGVGGVRLEDVVVVTEDGYRNLNDYPRDLRVV
ncbi:M24 family metallopeptidase [Halobacterium litoreum]|uniref:M24 family metallopeptidase n=1 Tax=Halobacterium litoreum TaxID=2039234 RepID=A0ABD5NDY9_9EURY|nr:Xaa-Pro peptidase family protein [Halobacterium litoreum]UHH13810.1 Xaa-Pro peptidase family protein [Halobacterium litoreum]